MRPKDQNLIVAQPENNEHVKEQEFHTDPQFDITDQDILKDLAECENENEHLMLPQQQVSTSMGTATKQVVSKKSSPQVPMFSNCQISGNITINFNKN